MRNAIITALLTAAIAAAFRAGYNAGVEHAICDSQIWTVDCYDPDNPDASAWNGYDQLIYIDLDGQLYEHGMIQG